MTGLRALIVTRLSRVTDATTSPERQEQACRELCAQRGYEVVGVAEDLDVSGAVDPFDRKKRPALARWLDNEEQPFDVIVAYRVDRLTRSIRHLQTLVAWAEDHDKIVVSATESHFDMSSPFAAVIIALLGTVAQMELEAIRERTTSAYKHNVKQGKYRGGITPWGYLPKQVNGEWRLVPDPAQVAVVQEVVARVLAGELVGPIARDLNARDIPTPMDCLAIARGKPAKGYKWHSDTLKKTLTSQTLLGHVVAREQVLDAQGRAKRDAKGNRVLGKGKDVVRSDDGSPVVRAEPILTREVFERLTAELASREKRGQPPTKRSDSLLLRVVFCGVCGSAAYRSGKESPRYRCGSAQAQSRGTTAKCHNRTLQEAYADDVVERMILGLLGESDHLVRQWDSGSDHSAELADIDAELTDLAGQLGTGVFKLGTPQRARLDERMAALAARQDVLSTEAVKPAGWTWKPTGEKFSDWWARQATQARNVWLRSMGVRLHFECSGTSKTGRVTVDQVRINLGDLETLTQQVNARGPAARWQELFAAMRESGVAGIEMRGDTVVFVRPDGQRVNASELASDVAEQLDSLAASEA